LRERNEKSKLEILEVHRYRASLICRRFSKALQSVVFKGSHLAYLLMQLSKRMGRGGSGLTDPAFSLNNDVENSFVVQNPLQPNTPSSAYLESQKRSRSESQSNPDRNPVNHRVRPGIRTIASAFMLFVGGIILLIMGTVVFCDTSKVVSKTQGLEILVIGAISKFLFKSTVTERILFHFLSFFS
jgi:hypothetical protein